MVLSAYIRKLEGSSGEQESPVSDSFLLVDKENNFCSLNDKIFNRTQYCKDT